MRHAVRLEKVELDPRLAEVFKVLRSNQFGDPREWAPLVDSITRGNDYYLVTVRKE